MAYTLTFSGSYYTDYPPTVNGVAATSGMTLKNGDVIVFYTGAKRISSVYGTRYSATMNGKSYAYNSSASTETVKNQNITITFTSTRASGSITTSRAAHTINFQGGEKRCTVSYGNQTVKTFTEAEMDSGHVSLKCAGEIASANIKVKFEEV